MKVEPVFLTQIMRLLVMMKELQQLQSTSIEVTPVAVGTTKITLTAKASSAADAKVLATTEVEVTVEA